MSRNDDKRLESLEAGVGCLWIVVVVALIFIWGALGHFDKRLKKLESQTAEKNLET